MDLMVFYANRKSEVSRFTPLVDVLKYEVESEDSSFDLSVRR